jgi:hypothetical protein
MLVILVYAGIDDVQGGIHTNRAYPQHLCYASRSPLVSLFRRLSAIDSSNHPSPTKLLNYITSPDTVIWSALLASAAVPGILNPVVLMQKLKNGQIVPWNWGSKFKDGSLRVDIPLQALNLYFNGQSESPLQLGRFRS